MRTKPIYGYFGHHKCASTWLEAICYLACHDLGLKLEVFYDESMFDGDLGRYVEEHDIDFIVYANADYRHVAPLEGLRGFHVVRDPRDIVVSAYFSHLKTHPTHAWPELVEYRKRLQSCSKKEGLHMEIEFRRQQFAEMMSWPPPDETPDIAEWRMEDIVLDPYKSLLAIFSDLGLLDKDDFSSVKRTRFFLTKIFKRIERHLRIPMPDMIDRLPAERLLGIVWENDFKKISGGRRLGEENPNSHYRKGIPGDWANHLDADHLGEIMERYGDLLKRYGYE